MKSKAPKLISDNKKPLPEFEAKEFLARLNIPVVKEVTARTPDEAAASANKTGFPVVLKGYGRNLLHKTELGFVRTGLGSPESVAASALEMRQADTGNLEGYLIQPQIAGKREFAAGLFRDPQFGPVVMFGVGGILAEALSDVSFRLAPLSKADAAEMIEEIRAQRLFGAFRGEEAVDRNKLADLLITLSRIGVEYPEISEIDINPIIITPNGAPVCVDALIIPGETGIIHSYPPAIDPGDLGACFHPKSIAFVGASGTMGKWGHMLPTLTIGQGFQGAIYFVNPRGGEIAGRQVYRSVEEVPGDIDLGVVTVPAAAVPNLIPQFEKKGVRNMLLISSGFSETGPDGKQIETQLIEKARKAGILVLGPNTMGIANPHIRLYCTGTHVWPRTGATSIVAQSGNVGTQLLAFAEKQNIGVRVFSGSGNEAMAGIEDYLEGFEHDQKTRIILLYLESVKNGRRFFESAKRISSRKPIILLKGGQTKAGNTAAKSHTGALALDTNIFNAVCRQAGVIKVEQPMDMLDLSAAFSAVPTPEGNRAAIMTLGGGWGVLAADMCESGGIEVPALSRNLAQKIDHLLPDYWSRSNPVDLVGEFDNDLTLRVTETLIQWDGCDALINLGIHGRNIMLHRMVMSIKKSDPSYAHDFLDDIEKGAAAFEKQYIEFVVELMEKYNKPIFGVSIFTNRDKTVFSVKGKRYKGLFYPTPERAVRAFSKMYEYHRFVNRRHQCTGS